MSAPGTAADPAARAAILDEVRRGLQAAGLDAYLAYTPSNVCYVTGFQSYFHMQWWRMQGTVMALVPADEELAPALLISDFEASPARAVTGFSDVRSYRLWVELRDAAELRHPDPDAPTTRPAQYDTDEQDHLVRALFGERGLEGGRIGTDLRHMLLDSHGRLRAALPAAQWVDHTDAMYAQRSVKHLFEVERLRRATELSEAGMLHAVADVRPGLTARDLRLRYTEGVLQAAMADERYAGYSDAWVLPTVGGGVRPGVDVERGAGLEPGDLVKFDCGATVDGYRGDGGRTFSFGAPRRESARLYDVLQEAHEVARSVMRPGVPISDVFYAAQYAVRGHGYPGYTRGHVGHSLGIDTFHEEPPFVSPDEHRPLEEGMVLAIETPSYTADVGAIMIEDLVHVTVDGIEVLHRLPHDLRRVGI